MIRQKSPLQRIFPQFATALKHRRCIADRTAIRAEAFAPGKVKPKAVLAVAAERPKSRQKLNMHPTARLQFERIVREYTRWRSVPEEERSPAPAWWWQPA